MAFPQYSHEIKKYPLKERFAIKPWQKQKKLNISKKHYCLHYMQHDFPHTQERKKNHISIALSVMPFHYARRPNRWVIVGQCAPVSRRQIRCYDLPALTRVP